MNLFDVIEPVARAAPTRLAVLCGSSGISFGGLLGLTATAGHRFTRAGIKPGDVVMVVSRNSLDNLLLGLSLVRMGAVPLSCGGQSEDVREKLALKLGVRAIVGAVDLFPLGLAGTDVLRLPQDGIFAAPQPGEDQLANCPLPAHAPMRVSLSSGTTDLPKGIVWSHQSALANLTRPSPVHEFRPGDRHLVFMDLGTNYGTNECLRALLGGAAVVLPTSGGIPELVRCLDVHGPTSLSLPASLAGALLDHVLAAPGPAGQRFPSLRRLITAGETMVPHRWRRLMERVCANAYSTYGASECGLLGWTDPEIFAQHPGATARLHPDVRAQALDENGAPLPAGETGQLRFQTPVMCSGYAGDAAQNPSIFRDGWFYSSDSGSVDAQGIVRLGARREDMLIWRAQRVDPTRIEAVVNNQDHIHESAAFVALSDRGEAVLMLLYTADTPLQPEVLRSACLEQLGEALTPGEFMQVAAIPRMSGGKISRKQLAERVRPSGTRP